MQRASKCPTCRCDIEATPVASITLQAALQQLYPAETHERAREEVGVEPPPQLKGMRSLPLFVLEPLLPGQKMHLHVFEPRYIALTQRALTESALDKRFGMVAATAHRGLSMHGVTVRITDWGTDHSGARFFLTVVGERRFRTLRTWDVDGYRNAEIAWAHDAAPDVSESSMDLAAATSADMMVADERAALPGRLMARECKALIDEWSLAVEKSTRRLDSLLGELGPAPDADQAEKLGLWCAALINPLPPLGLAPEIRLRALECTDSVERLQIVIRATESSLARMRTPRFALSAFLSDLVPPRGLWCFIMVGALLVLRSCTVTEVVEEV